MAYPVNHLRLTFHLSLKRKPKREGKNLVNLFGKRKSQNSNLNKRKKKCLYMGKLVKQVAKLFKN